MRTRIPLQRAVVPKSALPLAASARVSRPWSQHEAPEGAGSHAFSSLRIHDTEPEKAPAAEDPGAEAEARSQARELTRPFAPRHEEGQPLPASERAFFEPRLGVDLSGVRLHTGPDAAAEARRLHAKAFTVGPDIYWGSGQLQPGRAGRRLLGHELSHVVQQAEGGLALQRDDEKHEEPAEAEAEHPAAAVAEHPDVTDDVVVALKEGALEAAKSGQTRMTEAFIQKIMGDWRRHGDVRHVVETAATEFEGTDSATAIAVMTWALPLLLKAIESEFIYSKDTSSLDLLPGNKGKQYREFPWHDDDYPKDPASKSTRGPNEGKARALTADLTRIRPERRANRDTQAVITESWMKGMAGETQKAVHAYVKAQLALIPSHIRAEKGEQLNKHALASLEEMHAAARAEGVELQIEDAYRRPEDSARRAAQADNTMAVAKFSAHNLGLAIDFTLGFTWHDDVPTDEGHLKQKTTHTDWKETSTSPYPKVVRMRESPAHKWLFVRGAEYGWYPFQDEPWHFEYNPPGFRETFWSEAEQAIRTAISDAQLPPAEAAAKKAAQQIKK
jgi:D-alanyl-D-alanine dipeptidase